MTSFIIFLMQIGMGVFFGASGFHKLFIRKRHETLVETLRMDHVPLLSLNQWLVPITEFLGGLWLLTTVLPFYPAAALFIITLGACIFDAPKRVKDMHPLNLLDCASCWLYLCETWLLPIFLLIMAENWRDLEWMMQLL